MVPGGILVDGDVDIGEFVIAVTGGMVGELVNDGIIIGEVGLGRGVAEAGVGSEIVLLIEVNHAEAAAESEVETDRVVVLYTVEENTSVAPRKTS